MAATNEAVQVTRLDGVSREKRISIEEAVALLQAGGWHVDRHEPRHRIRSFWYQREVKEIRHDGTQMIAVTSEREFIFSGEGALRPREDLLVFRRTLANGRKVMSIRFTLGDQRYAGARKKAARRDQRLSLRDHDVIGKTFAKALAVLTSQLPAHDVLTPEQLVAQLNEGGWKVSHGRYAWSGYGRGAVASAEALGPALCLKVPSGEVLVPIGHIVQPSPWLIVIRNLHLDWQQRSDSFKDGVRIVPQVVDGLRFQSDKIWDEHHPKEAADLKRRREEWEARRTKA